MQAANPKAKALNSVSENQAFSFSQAWLEPRFVVVTLIAMILGAIGEANDWSYGVVLMLNITAYVAGGLFGAKAAIQSLMERRIDVDLLMILAALGAASIGEWTEGAMLLFLFSLSNVLQDYAIGRSRKAIQSLFKLYPEQATVRRDDVEQVVSFRDIRLDDVVIIRPGERIPVDGVVVSGRSAIDESPITGESMPVDKQTNSPVFAGTLNKQGTLDVRPTKLATETTLARIITMVEEAQENQAPTERFLDKFEQYYAIFILVAVGLFIVIPPLLGLVDFDSNFYRAMVLMTVASPCALVISVPASFISAIASAARMGVLFKGGAYLEQLADVKAIAFDKTGTLTVGEPRLTEVISCCELDENELLALAASAESRSEHPVARAIMIAAEERELALVSVDAFEAATGKGVEVVIAGQTVYIGSIIYLEQISPMPEHLASERQRIEEAGSTTMGVLRDGQWLGIIGVADQVRTEARAVIDGLHAQGLKVAMLTGDNPRVAHAIAEQLGIDEVRAGLMPEDKVTAVQELQARYGSVAMIGDGINDAPALATAEIGMAMGAAGTDVALETADIVLMADRIERIQDAIALSKKARRVVWQNIIFSLSVIVMLVLGAFIIDLPLPLGVLGHEGSTVIVVLNGLIALLILPEIQRRRQAQAA